MLLGIYFSQCGHTRDKPIFKQWIHTAANTIPVIYLECKSLHSIMLGSQEGMIIPMSLGSVSHLTLVNETTIVLRGYSASLFLIQCSNCPDKSVPFISNFYTCDRFSGLFSDRISKNLKTFSQVQNHRLVMTYNSEDLCFFTHTHTHTHTPNTNA